MNQLLSRRALVALFWTLGAAHGCANILDIPDDPSLVVNDPWQCDAQRAAPMADKARVTVRVCDYISTGCAKPVTGLTATLCEKKDVNCTGPIVPELRDVEGNFTFDVPTGGPQSVGFDGYLRITAPAVSCTDEAAFGGPGACLIVPMCDQSAPDERCKVPTYSPALLYFNPPIVADTVTPITVPLLATVAAYNLTTAAGSQRVDASQGVVFATIRDCADQPAAGMTLAVGAGPSAVGTLYQLNGVVSAAATATDNTGVGVLLGLQPGLREVEVYRNSAPAGTGPVASASVRVAPTSITYVTLTP